MKILLCYFSGTGNTKKAVDEYQKYYESQSHQVEIYNIEENAFNYSLDDFDLLGIFHPIYAFNAPSIIVSFCKKIAKSSKKKPFFVVKTSGEPIKLNNISSYKIKSIMKRRNYLLTNEYHYVMPYNIIFRHSDTMAYRMYEAMKKIIPCDAQEILDGKKHLFKYVFMGHLLAFIFRIEFIGGRFNGTLYKVNKDCIKCMKCVKACPKHNITYENDHFKFSNKCLMCMRCSFSCPKNAIKIGLFESWKVNGQYSFKENPNQDLSTLKHLNYCAKAYKRYFNDIVKRLENK
jgi:ferredoxin